MPTRSETMWAVVNAVGVLHFGAIRRTRRLAIDSVSFGANHWTSLRSVGWRAVKVTVTWETPE